MIPRWKTGTLLLLLKGFQDKCPVYRIVLEAPGQVAPLDIDTVDRANGRVTYNSSMIVSGKMIWVLLKIKFQAKSYKGVSIKHNIKQIVKLASTMAWGEFSKSSGQFYKNRQKEINRYTCLL